MHTLGVYTLEATLEGYSGGPHNLEPPILDLKMHTLGVYTLGGHTGRLLWGAPESRATDFGSENALTRP